MPNRATTIKIVQDVLDGGADIGVSDLDLGSSGSAGSLDVFPATASKGKVTISAADSAGNTTTTITNASQSGARTYTIPDAGASASFVMTEGAQTVNGVKTFGGIPVFPTGGAALSGATNNAIVLAADQANQENTYTVPDADTDADFVLTEAAQTINGVKTFGSGITMSDGSLVTFAGNGTGTGDVIQRIGGSATEGLELRVYEATVSPSAVETNLINVPAGSVIVSVQANVETALTGGGTTATWSIGTSGDPDKYGTAGYPSASDSLSQNSKSDWMGTWAYLTSAEQMVLTGTATGGASDGDTALTVGSVRVRVVYYTLNSLDNA